MLDWLGQKEPLPVPSRMLSAYACHTVRISGKRLIATAITSRAAISTRRGPIRSASEPATKPEQNAAAELTAAASPASPSGMPRTLCR